MALYDSKMAHHPIEEFLDSDDADRWIGFRFGVDVADLSMILPVTAEAAIPAAIGIARGAAGPSIKVPAMNAPPPAPAAPNQDLFS